MTKQVTRARRQARQSSIYRKLENLLGTLMAMTERIPKHACGLQAVGVRVVNEMLESLSATEFALHAPDSQSRLAYIATLIHSMTIVKTACRGLYDYSRKDVVETFTNDKGEVVTRKMPRYGRVISNAQYVNLLGQFSDLGKEIGRWYNATLLKMSQNQ